MATTQGGKKKLAKLLEKLRNRVNESGSKKSYWIEPEELRFLLCSAKYDTCQLNVDQGDGTYKTVVTVEGKKFQYVGEKVEC
jgi:hypothetical protein